MAELVSVCMPARNAAAWVAEAAASILSQTYEDLELIVVDDGSSDGTLDIVSDISREDHRLRYFSSSGGGVVAARQLAYRRANGTFIANMDADDLALPSRLEAQIQAMARGLDLCGTQFDFLFGSERRSPRSRLPLTQRDAFVQLFKSNPISNPSIMFRSSTFGPEGLPYNASYVPSADYELWSRLLRNPHVRFANLPGVHMLYRVHEDQLTRPRSFRNRVAAMRVRLDLLGSYGFNLDEQAVRRFCMHSDTRTATSASSFANPDPQIKRIDTLLQDLANQTFAGQADPD